MKAIVVHNYGDSSKLAYESARRPDIAHDEALVRVYAAGINPIDWIVRSGAVRNMIPVKLPWIPGYDLVGTIAEIGSQVSGFKVGDQVIALASQAYAEFCAVKASELNLVPQGLDLIQACTLPMVSVTGDQLVRLGAKINAKERIIITGALGGVGRAAVFAASEIGAYVIAGVRGRRAEEAGKLPGVSEVLVLDDERAINQLPMVDAVAETLGGEIAKKLIAKVKDGGRFGCFPAVPRLVGKPAGIEVNPIFGQANTATIRHYAEAMRDGHFAIPIAEVFSLSDAAKAMDSAEKGAGGKIILKIGSP